MKEIRFRGKSIETNEWVYGCLVRSDRASWIFTHGEVVTMGGRAISQKVESTPVIPETVGQFTGLKDKNGVEIYENDVVISTYGKWAGEKKGLTRQGHIVYDTKNAAFRFKINDSKITVSFNDVSNIEVIGNIHQHPELLEAK